MTKLVLTFLAGAAIAAPALAEAKTFSFERDGISYTVTETERNGIRYIDGVEDHSNRVFHLRVANGRVTGDYDGKAVAYAAPRASLYEVTASR